jgi:MoaA/NifB/PqqE/SkfB family radical SAM enzyme
MDDSHKGANERIHALSFDSLQPGISEPQVQQPLRHKSAIDVQSKLYQSDVVQRISEIDLSFKSIAPPFVVELDTTAACDLACPGCISEDIIAKGGRFSNQRLLELGEELIAADIRAVILIGGGEPLAHPRIADLIQLLGENEIAIGLTTNGTFIDRHVEQISRYCSWTRVSIDAATKETFDTLRPSKRGRSKWQTVIENTERLAKMDRKGLVGFSFLVQSPADGPGIKCNAMEIYDAAVLAKELGCDYFEVKPTYEFRGDVPHALVKHSLDARSVAEEQIARLNDL